MSIFILLLILVAFQSTTRWFQQRFLRKLPAPQRQAWRKFLDGLHLSEWLPAIVMIVALGAFYLGASGLPLSIVFPTVLVSLVLAHYISHRRRSERIKSADLPLEGGRTFLRLELLESLISSVLFAFICSGLWASEQALARQVAQDRAEEVDLARQQGELQHRLVAIKAEAATYAATPRHVINEESLRKNAEKSSVELENRRIYLKLPLHGVAYHWKFQEKAALLRGSLVLTIGRNGTSESYTIFQDGALSGEWEILDCCNQGPDEMYFGFLSKNSIAVSESNHISLHLSVSQDIRGIGAYQTATLRQGDYTSFTQFTIYHLKEEDDHPPMAFLNNDGWNISWMLEDISPHGWKAAK